MSHYQYDNLANLIREERGSGGNRNVKTWNYDARGQKTGESMLLGTQSIATIFAYDAKGRLVNATDPKGGISRHEYDKLDRKTATIDAEGNRTSMLNDKCGNRIALQTPEGEWTLWEFDELNWETAVVIDGTRKEFLYDNGNRLIREIGFNRQITDMVYDAPGRLIAQTEAQGTEEEATTRFEYDPNGNLTAIIDPRSNRAEFEYDALNRKIAEIGKGVPYEKRQRYEFDNVGNRISWIKGDGKTVRYDHDVFGRLKTVKINNVPEQQFEYDELSRMKSAIDYNEGRGVYQVSYEYDSMNRITAEIQNGKRVQRSYDNNSNLFQLSYPSGETITRRYTATNRLRHVISSSLGTVADISRDKNGRVTTMMQANLTQSFSYDAKSRETSRSYSAKGAELYTLATEYDPEGNITGETVTINGDQQIRDYFYDKRNRLTKDQAKNHSWEYDLSGNWTFTNQNGVDEHRTVRNESDAYNHIGGTINMTPEWELATGNLLSFGNQRYEYDWKNRLVKVFDGNNLKAEYHYDALDRRVSKRGNLDSGTSNITDFIYNGDQVIEEWQGGAQARLYVFGSGIDDPIMQRSADGNYYFHIKDRQGSIVAITDLPGNVIERYDYSAFGHLTITDGNGNPIANSQVGNPFTFTGRRWDAESGLYHYRKRAYSPALGRFLQKDPIGYLDGTNRYGYVHNNPLRYVDPMGLTAREPLSVDEAILRGITVAADLESPQEVMTNSKYIHTDAMLGFGSVPASHYVKPPAIAKMDGEFVNSEDLFATPELNPLAQIFKRVHTDYVLLNSDIPATMKADLKQQIAAEIGLLFLGRGSQAAAIAIEGVDVLSGAQDVTRESMKMGVHGRTSGFNFSAASNSRRRSSPLQVETTVSSNNYISSSKESLKNKSGDLRTSAQTARTLPHGPNTVIKRRVPKNLQEQITLQEAQGGAGEIVISNLSDPRYKGMQKMQHVHVNPDGSKINVHYVRDPKTGMTTDFKFK